MWWDTLYKHWVISGVVKIGLDIKRAAMAVPTILERKTIPQSRRSRRRFFQQGSRKTGMTVVIVFSVKSWSRPRITMRKPVYIQHL